MVGKNTQKECQTHEWPRKSENINLYNTGVWIGPGRDGWSGSLKSEQADEDVNLNKLPYKIVYYFISRVVRKCLFDFIYVISITVSTN